MNEILKEIGLSNNESKIYLAYLKKGVGTAAKIAQELALDKSSSYRAVENLEKLGLLISNPKKRGTTYEPANVEVLKEILNKKKTELKLQETKLEDFINKIKKQNSLTRNTYIKVEKGLLAVQQSMDASLDAAFNADKLIRERYSLDYPYFYDKVHIRWVNDFAKRRITKRVNIKQIVNFAGNNNFAPIMKTAKALLKEIRLMPEGMNDDHSLRISGDLVVIISFDEKKDYVVITIKDKYVAELMSTIFDFIWTNSKPL